MAPCRLGESVAADAVVSCCRCRRVVLPMPSCRAADAVVSCCWCRSERRRPGRQSTFGARRVRRVSSVTVETAVSNTSVAPQTADTYRNLSPEYGIKMNAPDADFKMKSVEDVTLSLPWFTVAASVLMVFLFLFTTVTNTLALVITVKRRRFRSVANRFVGNLSVLSVLSSSALTPLLLADLLLTDVVTAVLCQLLDAVCMFCVSSCVFATLLIAGDRYWAVAGALRYHAIVTRFRANLTIALCWTLALLFGALTAAVPPSEKYWSTCSAGAAVAGPESVSMAVLVAVALFGGPLAALVYAYMKIYLYAHKSSKKQRKNSRESTRQSPQILPTISSLVATGPPSRTQSLKLPGGQNNRSLSRSTSSIIVGNIKHKISNASLILYREESRTARVSMIVVAMFLVSWAPFIVMETMSAAVSSSPKFSYAAALLAASHGAVSPFLYSFRSERGRRELRQLLGLSTPVDVGVSRLQPLRRLSCAPPLAAQFRGADTATASTSVSRTGLQPLNALFDGSLEVRKTTSAPALLRCERQNVFQFPAPALVAGSVGLAGCKLPRCSVSSAGSHDSQESTMTILTQTSNC